MDKTLLFGFVSQFDGQMLTNQRKIVNMLTTGGVVGHSTPLRGIERPTTASGHLGDERIEKTLHEFIARKVARRVKSDTLIIVDPSDIQKPYATQMDFLSKVWDGSKGVVGDNLGYYGCMAVACENGRRRPMPMHLRFWSPDAPGFTSENDDKKSPLASRDRLHHPLESRGNNPPRQASIQPR